MRGKSFRNQGSEEIIKHLAHFLDSDTKYNLFIDPLEVYFSIVKSHEPSKKRSAKRVKIRQGQKSLSKGQRKRISTKKTTRPKIRTVKKYRTVPLKGVTY